MWNRYFALLVMAALLRADYELSRPKVSRGDPPVSYLLEGPALDQRPKEWADKAIRNYAAAQDRKWRRWREAMFEAK
jgi:hypothetical protein